MHLYAPGLWGGIRRAGGTARCEGGRGRGVLDTGMDAGAPHNQKAKRALEGSRNTMFKTIKRRGLDAHEKIGRQPTPEPLTVCEVGSIAMASNGPARVALVTGALRGIGRGIAERLSADDLDVTVNASGNITREAWVRLRP